MCNLSSAPLRREKRSKRQLANAQHSHCMTAAACQFGTKRREVTTVSVSEGTQQGKWFAFGPGTQLMVAHQDGQSTVS